MTNAPPRSTSQTLGCGCLVVGAVVLAAIVLFNVVIPAMAPKSPQERYEECMETGKVIGETGVDQEILCRRASFG